MDSSVRKCTVLKIYVDNVVCKAHMLLSIMHRYEYLIRRFANFENNRIRHVIYAYLKLCFFLKTLEIYYYSCVNPN